MTLLPVHIIGGLTAIVAGFVALYASKGATLHRQSGMILVGAMLVMSASGGTMALLRLNRGNVMGGALTFYMVTTALLTTRRGAAHVEWMDRGALLIGLAAGSAGVTFGVNAMHAATGRLDGYPPWLYFIFGSIALLSAAGDIRMMLARGLEGKARLVRHVWRMSYATFMATASFFLGQAKVIPKPIRVFPVLTVLALLPLVVMLYWLARMAFTKRYPRRSGDAVVTLPIRDAA